MSDAEANGSLSLFFVQDHRRLAGLLEKAAADGRVDPAPYAEFRAGILRHIEETLDLARRAWAEESA